MFVGALIFDRKKRIPTTLACKNEEDLNIMNQIKVKNHQIWVQIEANLKQIQVDLGSKAFIARFKSTKSARATFDMGGFAVEALKGGCGF